jgi:NADH:ubiquinone oxidoreductase subunit H
MSEGSIGRALVWSLAAATVLLAWPWLLAWLQARRPAWLAGSRVTELATLRAGLDHPGGVRAGTLAGWCVLVVAAAILPAGRGLLAADLDAGLLWLAVLSLLAISGGAARTWRHATGAVVTLVLCVLPAVLRTASLNLADLAVAQQGGAGNWFLLRDPFLLVAAVVFLLTVATSWPPPAPAGASGAQLGLEAALRAGLPLVLAQLFVVVFLGGWWAFAVFVDGAALVNTLLKIMATLTVVVVLRRRSQVGDPRHLERLLPVAGLVCAAGSAIWMTLTGAAW